MKEADTTTLWLVRHGKTMFNTSKRVQGWSDSPLTSEGKATVIELAKGLQEQTFHAMYSSDSGRARETLRLIAQKNNKPVTLQEDWRLREINFGSYEGEYESIMWEEVAQSTGKSLEQWWANFTPVGYVNDIMNQEHQRKESQSAESYETVRDRLLEALNDIVLAHPLGANILIVMHGGSIATLLSHLDSEKHKLAGSIKNASVSHLSYQPKKGFSVKSLNDMRYVEKGKVLQ